MTVQQAGARPVTPVGIVAALLARVAVALDGVAGLDPGLREDVRHAHALASGMDPYLSRMTSPESPALRRLADRTRGLDFDRVGGASGVALEREMLSGHVEGQAVKMLVHLTGSVRVLDLGMFTGYSALAMAEALPEGGEVVACELDGDVARIARSCFAESPHGHKISVRVAPAQQTLAELSAAGERFDLVFLDADKGGYVDYLTTLLDRELLAPRGVICADNTLLQGEPYLAGPMSANGAAIARFNQAVADDARVEQVLLPLRDGLTLVRRVDQR